MALSKIFISMLDLIGLYDLTSVRSVPDVNLIAAHRLSSPESKDFGGLSGVASDDSGNLISVADRKGYFIKSTIKFDKNILNIEDSNAGNINFTESNEFDVEDIAYFKGDCFVTHEIINQISLYKGCDFDSGSYIPVPAGVKDFHKLAGMESLGVNKEGKFFTIAEYDISDDPYLHKAFMWQYTSSGYDTIKKETPFYYKSSEGYGVSSMTFTDEGNLLVLERKYQKNQELEGTDKFLIFETKVKFVPKESVDHIDSGSRLSGQEIIYIFNNNGKSTVADNYEAITTMKLSDGSTSILVLSDDNLLPIEQTILLQFQVHESDLLLNTECAGSLAPEHTEMGYGMIQH